MSNDSSAAETALAEAKEKAHAGELGRRLKAAGAQVGDITVSLMWDNTDDLDLHCIGPTGSHIFWNSKVGTCGGYLDVDKNASDKHLTSEAVENMFWKKAPAGHYKVWVENNQERKECGSTPFTVRLTNRGEVTEKTFDDLEEYEEQPCFEFDLQEQAEVEAEVAKAQAQALMLEADVAALHTGHLPLRLAEPIIESANPPLQIQIPPMSSTLKPSTLA